MTTMERRPQDLYRFERMAERLPDPSALTNESVEHYAHDGFLAVENVLSADEVREAKAALADLIHGRIDGYDGLQPEPDQKERWPHLSPEERADAVRKVWRFAEFEPRLRALTQHPVLISILERLTGESVRLIQDMALLKPPHIGTEKPWHQDMAYFAWGPPEKVLGAWIALDAATAENGCMHMLPGTHREGAVSHIHLRDCQIPDEQVQVERDVIVPLAPGGVLFFSSMVHHGTPPNTSPNRRWALQYHYCTESAERWDLERHRALFGTGCRAR